MAKNPQNPHAPKKPIALPFMLLGDVALLAVCILSFAYFHHVKPQSLENDPNKLTQASIPTRDPYAASTTTSFTTTTEGFITTESSTSDAQGGNETTSPISTDVTTTTSYVSGSGGGTLTVSTTSTSVTTTTTTKLPDPDPAGWGSKWLDRFSVDDSVVITDSSYRSHDVAINIETRKVGNSVAYIADIYVRYVDNLKAAFAKGQYGKNITENTKKIADNNNAILAINGDYYGIRDNGIIVRNYILYRDTPRADVCSIFYDGTVTVNENSDYDLNAALQNGLYQTMSFGPLLVKDGVAKTQFSAGILGENPRTGFGYYEPGHYVFVTVDGRQDGYSTGMTMLEFGQLFIDLGCTNAYNLDGGQSAMMIFNGKVYNQPYNNGRPTSDIFYIGEVE